MIIHGGNHQFYKIGEFLQFFPRAKELGREILIWWSEKYDDSYGTKIAMTLKKKKEHAL